MKKVYSNQLYLGNVYFCDKFESELEYDLSAKFSSEMVVYNALIIKFNDRYIPFYTIRGKDDLNEVIEFASQNFLSKKNKMTLPRLYYDFPSSVNTIYVSDLIPVKNFCEKSQYSFKDLKNLELNLKNGYEHQNGE